MEFRGKRLYRGIEGYGMKGNWGKFLEGVMINWRKFLEGEGYKNFWRG